MIEILKSTSHSIHMQLTIQDIYEILRYIEGLEQNSDMSISITYQGMEKRFNIVIDSEVDKIIISKDEIKVYMDDEECKYFVGRLEEAIEQGYFFPAEVCEKQYVNRYITILCEIIRG